MKTEWKIEIWKGIIEKTIEIVLEEKGEELKKSPRPKALLRIYLSQILNSDSVNLENLKKRVFLPDEFEIKNEIVMTIMLKKTEEVGI